MQRHNETLFQLRLVNGYEGQVLTTKANHFKLQHAATTVYMMLPGHELPDWAFNQQEVNGHRQPDPEGSEVWVGDAILAGERTSIPCLAVLPPLNATPVDLDELDERLGNQKDRKPKSMNFFSRFIELQDLMFAHNAGLTASHPYASSPSSWPFAKKGISFWTQNEGHKQIYFVGNLVGWWTAAGAVFLIFGIFPASIFAERRNIPVLSDCELSECKNCLWYSHPFTAVTHRLWNSCGFFVMIWVVHFIPFFLFSRQLFLHHYLPAHLASSLIAGAVLNFICTETINYPVSYRGLDTPPKPREYADVGVKGAVIVGIFTILQFSLFVFMAPLTYGTPG